MLTTVTVCPIPRCIVKPGVEYSNVCPGSTWNKCLLAACLKAFPLFLTVVYFSITIGTVLPGPVGCWLCGGRFLYGCRVCLACRAQKANPQDGAQKSWHKQES